MVIGDDLEGFAVEVVAELFNSINYCDALSFQETARWTFWDSQFQSQILAQNLMANLMIPTMTFLYEMVQNDGSFIFVTRVLDMMPE